MVAYTFSTMLRQIIDWILGRKHEQEVEEANSYLLFNIETAMPGDVVSIILNEKFAKYMLKQPLSRFTSNQLSTRIVNGIVLESGFRHEYNCFMMTLVSANLDLCPAKSLQTTVFPDEIDSITLLNHKENS